MHITYKLFIIVQICLFLLSCDYKLDETYFKEITPPDESVVLDLSLIPVEDTIFIFRETAIQFSLNSSNYKVHSGSEFTYKDMHWQFGERKTKTITISPDYRDFSIDTLSLRVVTNSNTGSLADQLGYEGYYLEKHWIVITDTRVPDNLTVNHEITEDGFLKIFWNKCEQYNFKSYEIELLDKTVTINDQGQNFYVDSTFVGGSYIYSVKTDVYWPSGSFGSYGYENVSYELPRLRMEQDGIDSARIYWDKSLFTCQYTLLDESDNIIFKSDRDTTCNISRILFDNWKEYKLIVSAFNKDHYDRYANCIEGYLYIIEEGIHYNYYPTFTYSPYTQNLYSATSRDFFSHRGISTNLYNARYSIDAWPSEIGVVACPTNSPMVALLSSERISVFKDEMLNGVIKIPYKNTTVEHFLFSDNNKLAIVADGRFDLMDISTKTVVTTIDIPNYPKVHSWSHFTTSQDARYFCFATTNGVQIYNISNEGITRHFSDARSYKSAYFNPMNSAQLLLTIENSNEIEVRNVNNFNLEETIQLPSPMYIENIDPSTNYILMTNNEELAVIDLNTGGVIINKRFNPGKRIYLFNNNIFSRRGEGLDLTPYIQ